MLKTQATVQSVEAKTRDSKESRDSTDDGVLKKKHKLGLRNTLDNERMLDIGQTLLDRFEVLRILNGGGFAQIFLARDKETNQECAVKMESAKCDQRRMRLELTVLTLLRGKPHIPVILGAGSVPNGHFLILQLVGRNLSDIRRQLPGKKFSPETLYRTMHQIALGISQIHASGFLHRDLKPSNCCVGTVDTTHIYVLDYGLARQFVDGAGAVRKARSTVGMRGTMRYVSLEGHARKEFGPYTDLVALLYSSIELGTGSLPWSKLAKEAAIQACKAETPEAKLCAAHPGLVPFAEYVLKMKWDDIPDYSFVLNEIKKCVPEGVTEDTPYDWELRPVTLEHKKHEEIDHKRAEEEVSGKVLKVENE